MNKALEQQLDQNYPRVFNDLMAGSTNSNTVAWAAKMVGITSLRTVAFILLDKTPVNTK